MLLPELIHLYLVVFLGMIDHLSEFMGSNSIDNEDNVNKIYA